MIKKTETGYSVDVRPTGRDGKRFRKTFPTKAEAMAYERWIISEHSQKQPWEQIPTDRRTLAELAQTWHRLHGHTLKTGDIRLKELLTLIDKMGNPRADKITAKTYTDFRAERLQTVSANTVNHDLTYLRALFNELRRLGELHHPNPLADVRKISHDERELEYLEQHQINELLAALDEHQNSHARIQARLCLATGARWGEVAELKPSAIRAGKLMLTGTKNGKNRAIPISDDLARLAREHAPLTDGVNTFKRTVQRMGLTLPKGQQTHILRHTFASWFIMNGGDILTLQRILGHGSITMTMRYAHLSPDHLAAAVEFNPLARMSTS
jgi:integrase